MFEKSKGDYDYNVMAKVTYEHENLLMEKAQEYGEFCVLCDRRGLMLIPFEDFLKM